MVIENQISRRTAVKAGLVALGGKGLSGVSAARAPGGGAGLGRRGGPAGPPRPPNKRAGPGPPLSACRKSPAKAGLFRL